MYTWLQCWISALFFGRIADSDRYPLKIRADHGSRIANLAPSDIRRILQIRLPNADSYYIIKIESIFHGGMKLINNSKSWLWMIFHLNSKTLRFILYFINSYNITFYDFSSYFQGIFKIRKYEIRMKLLRIFWGSESL